MKAKPGTIVILKSGGPDMTVDSISEDGVVCVWFDGKRRTRATFKPEMLQRKSAKPRAMKVTFVMPGGRKLPGDPSN